MSKDKKNEIEAIYSVYHDKLCSFAEKIVGNREDAKDIVSDLFQDLSESPKLLSDIKSMKSYLYTSVRNKCLKRLKHIQIQNKYAQMVNDNLDLFFPNEDNDPLSELEHKETISKIQQAINSLPPKCKDIFVLAKIEGFTYQEIAEKSCVSVDTVHTHIRYALRKLRQLLKE